MQNRSRLIALLVTGFTITAAGAAEPLQIGRRLEPLVDYYLVEQMKDVRLVLNRPVLREVAIIHDAPWEGNTSCYHTVFRDGDRCRMYYRGSHYDVATRKSPHPEFVCYAESEDGISWRKPELGLFEFNDSKQNNIVWAGVAAHNFAPFKDLNPRCTPDARYKALAGDAKTGLLAFKSADGIHWSLLSEKPVITKGLFDSQNLAFYDTVRGEYREYHRDLRDKVRDILTGISQDFLSWSPPEWLEYPGAVSEHLYTNQITPYPRAPHILMGFPKRFMPDRKASQHPLPGVSDGAFMTSRDGRTFRRWGEALIRPGPQPDRWVNRNNMTAWGIIQTPSALPGAPDELSIYSTEAYYQGPGSRLRRFTVRLDGFVSMQASSIGGEFTTKLLCLGKLDSPSANSAATEGGRHKFETALVINFATSAAGSIRCEIQNETREPLPGYALSDCDEIYGDSVERAVTWRGKADMAALAGSAVRLRFVMQDADLYSIRFR